MAKRRSNSNDPNDWQIIGPANEYGMLRYRRPGSDVSEFGRVLNPQPNLQNYTKPVTTFSQLIPVHSLTPLLYDQISLEGRRISAFQNKLRWHHTAPILAKEFAIEKSFDGKTFVKIGIKKIGQANETYTFHDFTAQKAAYYRVHFKKGENLEYSNTIFIDAFKTSAIFSVTPNPISQGIEMQISGISEAGKWKIINSVGNILVEMQYEVLEFEKLLTKFVR